MSTDVRDPRRRGRAWRSVGRGVKVDSSLTGRAALLAELSAWQQILPPSATWTGLTGAEVHGLWLPQRLPGTPRFLALAKGAGGSCPIRPELAPARHPRPPTAVAIEGLRVEPVADCLLAAARFLPLLDLIVLMDSAVRVGRCPLADLEAAAGRHRRGAPRMRAALPLVDGRAESAMETLLRLLHVVCGVDVEVQPELRDRNGAFVARADLRVAGTDLLQEYDGADHREPAQQRADLLRSRRLADIGVERRGYVLRDLLDHAHLVLRAADVALGRATPTDPTPWLDLVARSLYSPAGRTAFLDRVRANWSHLPR